jgi:5-formyltetrahydrofolate cyclo-ligase
MPEILELRRSIRTEKLSQREALSEEVRQAASAAITSRVLTLIEEGGWKTIHCYLAFRSEATTAQLIEQLIGRGIKVIVPWVESDGELSHHQLLSLDGLSEGPYGLPHPSRNEFQETDSIEAVMLPLSAFDRAGNRLGYGKGFYDRFLQKLPAKTRRIGLAFAIQEAEHIPAMDHDQKLDMIVTENEIIITSTPA